MNDLHLQLKSGYIHKAAGEMPRGFSQSQREVATRARIPNMSDLRSQLAEELWFARTSRDPNHAFVVSGMQKRRPYEIRGTVKDYIRNIKKPRLSV